MLHHHAVSRIAFVCVAVFTAAAVAGCKNSTQVFESNNDGGWFSKPVDMFAKPDWAKPAGDGKAANLGPKGPVAPEELVGADGRCAAPIAETAQASAPPPVNEPPADRPVGSVAGDLAGAPMPAGAPPVPNTPAASPAAPQVMGGIALGMTECQAVQRAGIAGNVAISAGDKGERSVTLTYLSGPWPGIYRFADGRLKEIERAPGQPEPKKPVKKTANQKPAKKPNTAVQ